jgi:hypothetical protein
MMSESKRTRTNISEQYNDTRDCEERPTRRERLDGDVYDQPEGIFGVLFARMQPA